MVDNQKEALRAFVRESDPALTREQPVEQLARVWDKARELTTGQPVSAALWLALDATNSDRRKEESEEAHRQRVENGVPATLFGATAPGAGTDKPRHFFAAALVAFYLNRWFAEMAGVLVEVGGFVTQPFGGTGFDRGDIHADNCGAKFGQALKQNRRAGIRDFVVTMPG